jgi:hypothetical protein
MANGPGLVSGFFGSSKASHSIPEHFLKAFLYLVLFHDVGDRNILRPVFFFVDSNIFSHLLTGRLFSSTTNETYTLCSKHFRRFFQKHLVLIAIQAKADSDTVLLCVAFMVFEPTFFLPWRPWPQRLLVFSLLLSPSLFLVLLSLCLYRRLQRCIVGHFELAKTTYPLILYG